MGRATFREIVAEVQRKPGLETQSLGEIFDAVATASRDIGNQPWPWNYAETNVLVPAPISSGTVNVTDQTSTVTLVGGAWPLGLIGWRIRFGNSNLDYIVQTVVNPTTITLAQPVNLGSNLVNSSYMLYQDTYFYPADYIVGSDVALLQPTIRTRIPKIPRYQFEIAMNAGLRSFSTNIQMFYCDQGQGVDAFGTYYYQFRLGPPPAGPAELRLCYHAMSPDFASPSLTSLVMDGYDEIIGLMACAKLYNLHRQEGLGNAAMALATGKIKLLKRQIATQTIDDVPRAAYEVPDSSISQWGMMIGRVP